MNVIELAETVKRAGGVLELKGESVRCLLPKSASHLADELRERKPELISLLRNRGGRIATFPHCPSCASYYLFRKDDVGPYECQTCGLQEIEGATARRLV